MRNLMTTLALAAVAVGSAGPLDAQQQPTPAKVPRPVTVPRLRVTVPRLLGRSLDQGRALLDSAGLKLGRVDRARSTAAPGTIIRQSIPPDTVTFAGDTIDVTVAVAALPDSAARRAAAAAARLNARNLTDTTKAAVRDTNAARGGQRIGGIVIPQDTTSRVRVPGVIGMSLSTGSAVLQRAGLALGPVTRVESDAEANQVLSQQPESGTVVRSGTRVGLRVAVPRQTVRVPNLIGSTPGAAVVLLKRAQLTVGSVDSVPRRGGRGLVESQDPPGGASVSRGTPVAMHVSVPMPLVVVPSLLGSRLSQALRVLHESLGLGRVEYIAREGRDSVVVGQEPGPGSRVVQGTQVGLTVAVAPQLATVPNLVGRSRPSAEAALDSAGLTSAIRLVSSGGPAGVVLAQRPTPGAKVRPGTSVSLEIAAVRTTTVPKLMGSALHAARGALQRASLTPGPFRYVERDTADSTVVAQEPRPGAVVPIGTPVAMTVSAQRLVAVPDVVGRSRSEAAAAIGAAGLTVVRVETIPADTTQDIVISQTPTAGSLVPRQTGVSLQVAAAPWPRLPNVVGERAEVAESLLRTLKVQVDRTDSAGSARESGVVLTQYPAAGTVARPGMVVHLRVGTWPPVGLVVLVVVAGLGAGSALTVETVRRLRDLRWRKRLAYEPHYDSGRQELGGPAESLFHEDVQLLARRDPGRQEVVQEGPLIRET